MESVEYTGHHLSEVWDAWIRDVWQISQLPHFIHSWWVDGWSFHHFRIRLAAVPTLRGRCLCQKNWQGGKTKYVARFIIFSFSMLQYIHVEVPKSGPLQHRMPPATAAQRAVPGQWTTAAAAVGGSLPKDSLGVPARITLRESNMASWEIQWKSTIHGASNRENHLRWIFHCHVWFPEGMDQGNSAISIISSGKKSFKKLALNFEGQT